LTENVETPSNEYGLKEDWGSIQRTLEEIIPVYDKTNRFISLGSDLKLRRKGISTLRQNMGRDNFSLLDLGCGTGKMTQLFGAVSGSVDGVLLVDPILEMMRVARFKSKADGLLAVYENLPFRRESVDAAMAGFSIRDAKDLTKALGELYRILKPSGLFLIVDLSKPDSKVKSRFISIYWRVIAPVLAFAASGSLGLKFAALSKTYDRLPKISEMINLFDKCGFLVSSSAFFMLGGACIFVIQKAQA